MTQDLFLHSAISLYLHELLVYFLEEDRGEGAVAPLLLLSDSSLKRHANQL